MRVSWIGLVCIVATACAPSEPPRDATVTVDAVSDDASGLLDAGETGPPDIACGPDVTEMMGFDPCLHWVVCIVGDEDAGNDLGSAEWAATYSNGTCEAGRCTFADPPILTQCPSYCLLSGAYGRCASLGPTAA